MKSQFDCKLFGRRLNQARRSLGLTQVQAAELAGVSQGNISDFEAGTSEPKASTIIKFAEAYHVSGEWLLGISDEK